jgi:hypothetical protein
MTQVDNWRESNWWRIYSFRLKQICDEAWNCWNWTKDYNHNIYANSTNLWTFEFSWSTVNNFTSWNIAYWKIYPLTATLKDIYWNAIVPASWIHRTIDFNFNTDHNLNLNQYNNTWNAVFLTTPNDSNYTKKISTWTNINTIFDKLNSSDWKYNFNWQIYAPTNLANDPDNHDFIIKNVKIDINWILWKNTNQTLWNSSIDFNFNPLYTTTFSWAQTSSWLIEWVVQSWSIKITKKELCTYK